MTTLYPDHRITPAAIHAAAVLNHVETVAPVQARILDIGCGAATGLVTNAAASPAGMAIGIDLDEEGIASGQRLVQLCGLQNVELFAAGLGDLLAVDPGEFDYIIIHGLFSLAGQVERDALLGWCAEHLAENGVVCLHWSVLPGGQNQTLRDALAFHCHRGAEDSASRLSAARGMLSFLAMTLSDSELKNQVLEAEQLDDTALSLGYLGDASGTLYFSDFCQAIEATGLCYVGDAIPQYELSECYSSNIARLQQMMAGTAERRVAQQYLDFAVNRSQRFSLLSRPVAQPLPPLPDLSLLDQLHWAGNFRQMLDQDGQVTAVYLNSLNVPIGSPNIVTRQILDLLGGAWPMSLSFDQLVFNCRQVEVNSDARQQVRESLQSLFMKNIDGLYWSASPGLYNAAENDSLQLIIPCEQPSVDGDGLRLVNLWGREAILTAAEWHYVHDGMQDTGEQGMAHYLSLRDKGLLTGSPLAWKQHLQRFLRAGNLSVLKSQLTMLLLLTCSTRHGGLQRTEINDIDETTGDIDVDAVYDEVKRLIRESEGSAARQYTEQLLEANPGNWHLLQCYSRASIFIGAWQDALQALCQLLGHHLSSRHVWFELATVLQNTHDHDYAGKILRVLLRVDDKNADLWYVLADIHQSCSNSAFAEKCYREGLRYQQMNTHQLAKMGVILSDNQKIDEARYFLEKSLQRDDSKLEYLGALLFVMMHDYSASPEELKAKHLEYGDLVDAWAQKQALTLALNNSKDPRRKLRVGFVSGDLRKHPVANFLLPFWDNLDRSQFDVVGYSTFQMHDAVTDHLRSSAALWRDVAQMGNVELAKQINADAIDILFDLSGHTTHNRLPVFALRPAPIQISWIGYPGTTGISKMDYRLLKSTLRYLDDLESHLVEKIIFIDMPTIFRPEPDCPPINALPALKNGYFTFGSLNRPKKINNDVLRVWAQILLRCPQSRLLIGFMCGDDMIASLRKRLVNLGVNPEQLIFRNRMPLSDYMALHHEIDLLLDVFPYTGGTTTNHAVWMGVPTLTLCGRTIPGRQGVDAMRTYGLDAFIASDEEDYIARALYWHDHQDELESIRQGMRARIPTENSRDFKPAATFEKALREAWRLYCAGEEPRTFLIEA